MNLLQAVTTADLIAELTHRKRIRIVKNSSIYFNGAAQDDSGYMQAIDDAAVREIARGLNNKLYIAYEDTALVKDEHGRATKTTRTASLTILVPEGADE